MTIFEELDRRLLPQFTRKRIDGGAGEIQVLIGGSGPPLLLLHGDPQTHLCWHRIAPELVHSHTVVLTDIRGRGESHKPGHSAGHIAYSKREMAREQVAVMAEFGFARFSVVGHDRGARVARRMALDHPEAVSGLAVMDIVPELDFYDLADAAVAQDYHYFFFLTQPAPLTEQLITGSARQFMLQILTGLGGEGIPFESEALDLYLQASTSPEAIVAMCECFRAGISCDVEADQADRGAARSIGCPTLVLWGERGVIGRHFDPEAIWRNWAPNSRFVPLPCGHFIPEEAPESAAAALLEFLDAAQLHSQGDATDHAASTPERKAARLSPRASQR